MSIEVLKTGPDLPSFLTDGTHGLGLEFERSVNSVYFASAKLRLSADKTNS